DYYCYSTDSSGNHGFF
nr:immunoglobulin light chain junction region [Macaca mulatta]MOW28862.1 immunoglobulin light chain junction region [Macaca mulatta]MOX42146.1 immunoglobulin light chain junction region [Macaca mulatta]MOX42149.1 immunoglobulin light chain junction region [Macaca mulatta]MOX42750.1 immunoglobulin light chain junction region [Macaca mulatta]